MSQFIVLDHLLRSEAGHHFSYDVPLLRAATRQGRQAVLAVHHEFADQQQADARQMLDPAWRLCCPFLTSDSDYRWAIKLHRAGRKLDGFRQSTKPLAFWKRGEYALKQWIYRARFDRVIRGYGEALDQLWAECSPRAGDVIFLPSTMVIDLAGLADWVGRHPAAADVDWRFNLHFPLVNLETWYGQSVREFGKLLLWYPQLVADLAAALPSDRTAWYTTSESMQLQLAHFIGRQFEILPYPVNPALTAARADDAARVLLGHASLPQGRLVKAPTTSRQASVLH